MERRRTLLVVTGPSCAGKTTLAALLGHELSLPVIHRDALKETLFGALGSRDRAWSRTLGGASYELLFTVLESLLRAGCSCVVESNFEVGRASRRLQELCERYSFTPVELVLYAELETLHRRYRERLASRHPGHVDHLNLEEQRAKWVSGQHGALGLGGESVRLDTTKLGQAGRAELVARLSSFIAVQ